MKTLTNGFGATRRWVSGIVSAALCVMLAVLSLGGCSEEDPAINGSSGVNWGPFDYENTLVFERSSGDTIQLFSGFFCWCDEWDTGGGVSDWTLHLFAGFEADSLMADKPAWLLKVVVSDFKAGVPIAFPNEFVAWNQPKDATFFVNDQPHEYSSATDDCSGHITINRLSCGAGGGIDFTIDAVIGDEYAGDATVTVTGSYVAPLAPPPY